MTEWNESQLKVLESLNDDCNVLVSAAAGSGKTAVLVERIIRSVTEGRCGIDELLVVTFTRAAAAQMKAKIIKALEDLCQTGENPEIVKQLSLAESADITTIDGFCNRVVKENFNQIGIDPAYDFYDAQEAKMLQEDILEECFEEWYRDDADFAALSGIFMKRGMEDDPLKEAILAIYRVSQSHADEFGFFEGMREEAEATGEEVKELPWVKAILSENKNIAFNVMANIEALRERFVGLEGSDNEKEAAYMIDFLNEDILYFGNISGSATIEGMYNAVHEKQKTFSKKSKCAEAFGPYIEEYAEYRKNMQKLLQNVPDIKKVMEEQDKNRWMTLELIDCTERFSERLLEEKKKNRKYEFGDIAHFAYEILQDTAHNTAKELRDRYRYIYIDEYQDSNDLQEEILNSVARHGQLGNTNNIFMVGDVKQSIYRFRLAKPKLFMDKSEEYSLGVTGRLINLNTNYRSCREILEGTNFVFRNLMKKELGGIEYDKDAELNYPEKKKKPAVDFSLNETGQGIFNLEIEGSYADLSWNFDEEDDYIGDILPELILMTDIKDGEDESDDDENAGFNQVTPDEAEAMLIGKRIKELAAEGVPYGDITILMRTVSGTEPMIDIMRSMGIPVKLESSNGYFDAAEVVTMLSILSVIDNARQDIPFASVLLSEIGNMMESELAEVVTRRPLRRRYMYDMCVDFSNAYIDAKEENLRRTAEKIQRVINLLDGWRSLKSYITIAELVDRILSDTGYEVFVSSMPGGEIRLANLRMLRYRAESFEKSGFTSLFDFLRYIEKCKIHDIDFGKAETLADAGNAVHVSSIHSSKGLEYPVVILARAGHGFNMKDNSSKVLVDPDFGIAHDIYETGQNGLCITRKSIRKETFKGIQRREMIAEEMRLLYVAFTRPKQRLIITGRVTRDFTHSVYSFDRKLKSRSFMDMILPATGLKDFDKYFNLKIEKQSDIIAEVTGRSDGEKAVTAEEGFKKLQEKVAQAEAENPKKEDNPYNYRYPYPEAVTAPSKAAVSGIERAYTIKLEEEGVIPRRITAEQPEVPEKEDIYPGTRRGTVVHKIMELLDYSKIDSRDDLDAEIDRIMKKNFFTDEDRKHLRKDMVLGFYSDDEKSLFRRMKNAAAKGMLYREKSFLMGMKPSEIPGMGYSEESFDDDMITVQGIVDAFFYEVGEDGKKTITLIDYKTDNVKKGEELIDRYSVQLELYALSLSRITDAKINGIIFYCFKLHEEVNCPVKLDLDK